MIYKLIVKRGYYEYHFLFKKVQEAADFVEEFMNHMVPCGDPEDDRDEVKFTIHVLKKDKDTESEDN